MGPPKRARACSTIAIARSTPAQKLRGLASNISIFLFSFVAKVASRCLVEVILPRSKSCTGSGLRALRGAAALSGARGLSEDVRCHHACSRSTSAAKPTIGPQSQRSAPFGRCFRGRHGTLVPIFLWRAASHEAEQTPRAGLPSLTLVVMLTA